MSWHEMAYVTGMTFAALCVALMFGYCSFLLRHVRPSEYARVDPTSWTYGDMVRVALFYLGVVLLGGVCAGLVAPADMPKHASRIATLIATTFANVVICLYIVVLGEFRRGKRLAEIGLTRSDLIHNVFRGIVLYICFCPVLIASLHVVEGVAARLGVNMAQQPLVSLMRTETSATLLAATTLLVIAAAPITEEVIFRGFLCSALRENVGSRAAIVLSASVFALAHPTPFAIFPIFLLGLLLGWAFERTRTLAVPITIHMAHNAVTIFCLLISR